MQKVGILHLVLPRLKGPELQWGKEVCVPIWRSQNYVVGLCCLETCLFSKSHLPASKPPQNILDPSCLEPECKSHSVSFISVADWANLELIWRTDLKFWQSLAILSIWCVGALMRDQYNLFYACTILATGQVNCPIYRRLVMLYRWYTCNLYAPAYPDFYERLVTRNTPGTYHALESAQCLVRDVVYCLWRKNWDLREKRDCQILFWAIKSKRLLKSRKIHCCLCWSFRQKREGRLVAVQYCNC